MGSKPIFISYRRDDTRWAAAMVFQAVEWAFGENSAFFDRATIAPGEEWPGRIRAGVEQCHVVLAVIGKGWLTATDSEGRARLHQDDDWVRQELRTALNRADRPLVIPVFVDDAAPPRADQLPPDLAALSLRQGRSVREVPDFDADIAAVVEQIAAQIGVRPQPFAVGEREKLVAAHYATRDGGNRQRMIGKVREAWIHGVLEKSLDGTDGFTLGLDYEPTAVVQPRGLPATPLLDSRNIAEVFEEFDRRLLVLGSPGAGKTILLLQLARRLLNDADREINAPIPVILNLSSWAARRLPLHEWLAQDLAAVYQVPVKVARDWIEEQKLLLLLDGLDEVAAEHRVACVDSINAHLETWSKQPIAVCSRFQDYEQIGVRLKLRAAVRLEPLDLVRAQKLTSGPEYAGVRAVADKEPALREMFTVPFLLNLIRVAYRGKSAERLTLPPGDDLVKARREDLFETYIEARLSEADANSATRKPPFYRRLVRRWLSWLAASMQQRGQSVFYIESLQGTWLPSPLQRMVYVIVTSMLYGAVIGSLGGSALGISMMVMRQDTLPIVPILSALILEIFGVSLFLQGAIGRIATKPLSDDWGPNVSAARPLLSCAGICLCVTVALYISNCFLIALSVALFAGRNVDVLGIVQTILIISVCLSAVIAITAPILLLVFRGVNVLFGHVSWWKPWMPGPTIAIALLLAFFFCVASYASFVSSSSERWPIMLLALPTLAVFPALVALGGMLTPDIQTVERLRWRWSWIGMVVGGVLSVLLLVLWSQLFGAPEESVNPIANLAGGAILGGVWGGVRKSAEVNRRGRPGSGLLNTFRHNIMISAMCALIGACALGLFNAILVKETPRSNARFSLDKPAGTDISNKESRIIFGVEKSAADVGRQERIDMLQSLDTLSSRPKMSIGRRAISGVVTGAALGILFGLLVSGSDALLKHVVLRCQFLYAGCLPLRLILFLEHASDCLLIRRVGAGYIFLHRYLLEHFAVRCPESLARRGPPAEESAKQSIR